MGNLLRLAANVRTACCTCQGNVRWMDLAEPLRVAEVLHHVYGLVLDIGCGYNNLVSKHGRGVGIDIYPWPGINVLVDDSSRLPFPCNTFDTATILAALNHIPNREAVLLEVGWVLKDDGCLIMTMIGPVVGYWAHVIFRQDEQLRGGMTDGELAGMTDRDIATLLHATRFNIVLRKRFEMGSNRLYIARPFR